jgi:hypothetical protein
VAGGWLCLAAVVGLVVGKVIRNRDRQVPTDSESRPPADRGGAAEPTARQSAPPPSQPSSRIDP